MTLPPDISYRLVGLCDIEAAAWEPMLSPDEKARLEGYSAEKRRLQFIAGRVAARTLVAERLDLAPDEVPICVAADGAVELPGLPYHLSISHAGDRAVAALASRPVGVDVERITARHPELARRFLNLDELALLDGLPMGRDEALMLCWAIKEAVLKGRRTGLRESPRRLRMELSFENQAAVVRVSDAEPWQVGFGVQNGYVLAIAYPAP